MRNIINLLSGILGIVCGIAIIVIAITEIEMLKGLWLLFTLCCFFNTIFILHKANSFRKNIE